MDCAERGLDRRPARRLGPASCGSATARRCVEAIDALIDRAGRARRAARAGQPPGGRADRRRGRRPGPARQGAGAARLRPARACTRWRWAWPSAPGAPTTTARGPTRPTSRTGPTAGAAAPPSARAGDRDRGPRRADRLADPLQVPPRRLHRLLRRGGRDARGRDRLGRLRRRAARGRAPRRQRPQVPQPARGLDPGRGHAAGPPPGRRPRRPTPDARPDPGPSRIADRRLLRPAAAGRPTAESPRIEQSGLFNAVSDRKSSPAAASRK